MEEVSRPYFAELRFSSTKELQTFIDAVTKLTEDREAEVEVNVKTVEGKDVSLIFTYGELPKKKKPVKSKKAPVVKKAPAIDVHALCTRTISSLKLDRQVEEALNKANLHKVGDLASMTEKEILALPKIGISAVAAVKKALHNIGITKLGINIPN